MMFSSVFEYKER